MASDIIGTYPILQDLQSYTDQFGITYTSYFFTVPTISANAYTPTQDSPYYGPNTQATSAMPGTYAQFRVVAVDSKLLNGGLTEIMVKTAGASNINPPPKISLLPNYPLIFGLKQTSNTSIPEYGVGNPTLGLGVEMRFMDAAENEGNIFSNLLQMPVTFRGVALPVPSKLPFTKSWNNDPLTGGVQIGFSSEGGTINYKGFTRKEISFQRIGGVTLFRIIFAEAGEYYTYACPPATGQSGGQNCQTAQVYNFFGN